VPACSKLETHKKGILQISSAYYLKFIPSPSVAVEYSANV
jgi:hypothetical protein